METTGISTAGNRRDVLRWTAGAAAAAVASTLGVPRAGAARGPVPGPVTAGAAAAAAGLRPVAMAMHLHGSASEGRGSMAAHLAQATALGVDVVWWTDHDFRHQGAGYRTGVGLDAKVEPGRPGWQWRYVAEGPAATAPSTAFVSSPRSPDEPGRAMRIALTGPKAAWSGLLREADAENSTTTRTLDGTRIGLDVLLEQHGPDAVAVVRVLTSYHPAGGGRAAGHHALEYRLGDGVGRWSADGGRTTIVGLPATPGAWQRLSLDPVADAAEAWPDLVVGDLGLYRLQLGARSRHGARASVVFDRLRFDRGETAGSAALVGQRRLMDQYAPRYPAVTQHQGYELSLVRHLNVYGGDLTLPDYGDITVASKDSSLEATRAMVDFAHAHGSLVTLNHPLDEGDPRELGAMLVRERALGVDMLEVGVRSEVAGVIEAYDTAARNAVFLTATGTSDDHLGADWRAAEQRWVTSAWAESTSQADLMGALRRGEAYFWDLLHWQRGSLETTVHGSVPMGGVMVTDTDSAPVTISAPELRSNLSLTLVRGAVDLAGPDEPTPLVSRQAVTLADGAATLTVPTTESCYVRVEARTRGGTLAAFSNPTWILREVPPAGIPPERRHVLDGATRSRAR